MTSRALGVAASLLAPLTLGVVTGCGAHEDRTATGGTPGTSPSARTTIGILSPPHLPQPPAFAGAARGVIADVTVDRCDREDPGPVTASGTVTNTADRARDVVITVNWAVPGTADVLARGIAEVHHLAPGARTDWQVTARVASHQGVSCVPSALAGRLR